MHFPIRWHTLLTVSLAGTDLTASESLSLRGTPKGPSDNCKGSMICSGNGFIDARNVAISRYIDGVWYNTLHGAVSHARTHDGSGDMGGCTAIFSCDGHPNQLRTGEEIRSFFKLIYDQNGCDHAPAQGCGSHYIPGGKPGEACRVTLNYCWNCQSSNLTPAGPQYKIYNLIIDQLSTSRTEM